jgi:hypothetical protein
LTLSKQAQGGQFSVSGNTEAPHIDIQAEPAYWLDWHRLVGSALQGFSVSGYRQMSLHRASCICPSSCNH